MERTNAIYINICPNIYQFMPSHTFLKDIMPIATIWKVVFSLPHIPAAMIMPLLAARFLNASMVKSLASIITAIHQYNLSKSIKAIKAAATNILSAIGSNILPKSVIILYFLAI